MRDAAAGLVDGLMSRDLSDSGPDYSRNIPSDRIPKFVAAAQSMIAAGVNSPNGMAWALDQINPALRQFSKSIWAAFLMVDNTLPSDVDWNAIYKAIDKKPELTPPAPKPRAKAESTDTQAPYDPESTGAPFETLIPRGISEAVRSALEEITANRGQIDEFVADSLDMSVADLHKAMSAEQIDGVAMAIYQMETGGALVIGDETGIGKGRQAASLIRYAVRKGKIPVFFTKDPKLFSDMWGDLKDIGTTVTGPNVSAADMTVRPLVLGDSAKAKVVTPDGDVILTPSDNKQQRTIFNGAKRDGFESQGYNAIWATYSQIRDPNERQSFLEWLASENDVVVILDEAHEAAGDGETSMQAAFMMGGTVKRGSGSNKVEIEKSGLLNSRGAMHPRGGVLYLSATFAKRPDNMPVYFRTDLRRSADSFPQVVSAMQKGGVALQQAVTEALAEAGQYSRRERDFTGISYTMKRAQVADEAALIKQVDQVTSVLSKIARFTRIIRSRVADSTAMSGNQMAMTEFASIVHNQVSQLLLAAKADAVVDEVVAAHRRGEKPIVGLMNTMESFLKQYTADLDIKPGQEISLNWNALLEYALSRTLRVSEKLPNGDTSISTIDPAEYNLDGMYNAVRDAAREIEVSFPVSPIDYIIQKAKKAGVNMGELTGRESGIEYVDFQTGQGIYRRFKKADKNRLVNGFNSGEIGGLLLNASGATGLSIHASEKFKDQKPRHMIIAQPPLDINVFIQMLGRIKRTGIVLMGRNPDGSAYGARYSHLTLPLNAELRPAVMAARKMKSLNANTTGESDSAVKIEAEDLMNRFGNQAVAEYLNRNQELASALDITVEEQEDGTVIAPIEVARRFTGRMALTPDAFQGRAYSEITQDFRRAIEQAKATGDYDLEIIVHDDWDGERKNSEQITKGTDESSIFTASVNAERWEITDNRPTPSGADMLAEFKKESGSAEQVAQRWSEFAAEADRKLEGARKHYQAKLAEARAKEDAQPLVNGLKDVTESARYERLIAGLETKVLKWEETKKRLDDILDFAGEPVALTTEDGEEHAMMTEVKFPDLSKSLRLSPSAFRFAYLLNRPGGRVFPTLAQFKADGGYLQSINRTALEDISGHSGGRRETRIIMTGNPIRAFAATGERGKVVRFKARDGAIITGLMMPRNWKVTDLTEDPRAELSGPDAVQKYVTAIGTGFVSSGDGVRINFTPWDLRVSAPSAKRTGGAVFLDPELRELTGDFVKNGARMTARVYSRGDLAKIAERIVQITRKRFRGENLAEVRRANGQGAEVEVPTASKSKAKSAAKESATRQWNDRIENGPSESLRARPFDDLVSEAVDARTQAAAVFGPEAEAINADLDALVTAVARGESVGNPSRAYSMADAQMRAVDQFREETITPETHEQWKRGAEALMAQHGPTKAMRMVIAKGQRGDVLSPEETYLAKMLLVQSGRNLKTAADVERARAFRFAYRQTGAEAARSLAARVDDVMTPAERMRAYLLGLAFDPSAAAKKQAAKKREAAKDAPPAEAAKLRETARNIENESSKQQLAKLQKDLAKSGFTLDEWLNTDVLIVQDAPIFERLMRELGGWKADAVRSMQGGDAPFKLIARQTGKTEKEVQAVRKEFEARFAAWARSQWKPGMTADDLLKLSSQALSSRALASADLSGDSFEAVLKEAKMKMGLVPPDKQGKAKVRKERKTTETGARITEKHMVYVDMADAESVIVAAKAMGASRGDAIDRLQEYWYFSQLSAPTTQVTNASGYPIHLFNLAATRTLGSLMNSALGLVGAGNALAPKLGDLGAMWKAALPGIADAWRLAAKSYQHGIDFLAYDKLHDKLHSEASAKDIEKLLHSLGMEAPARAWKGKLGSVIHAPFTALQFVDVFGKTVVAHMEAASHAYRIAKQEQKAAGATGEDDLVRRMQILLNTPGSDAWRYAIAEAVEAGFQTPLKGKGSPEAKNSVDRAERAIAGIFGKIDEALSTRLDDPGAGKLLKVFLKMTLLPYVKTPYNIVRVGLRKSPFGAVAFAARALEAGAMHLRGKAGFSEVFGKFHEHLAEQLLAWGAFLLLAGLTEGDDDDDEKPILLTGGPLPGAYDREENMLRTTRYGGDYVLRVGDRETGIKLPFGRLEPFATAMGTTVDLIRTSKMDAGNWEKSKRVLSHFMAQTEQKTFLQGVAGLLGVIDDLRGGASNEDKLKRMGMRTLSAIVPNLVKSPVRNADEVVREYSTSEDWYPFFPSADGAEPRITPAGQEIKKGGNAAGRIFFMPANDTSAPMEPWQKVVSTYNARKPSVPFDEGGTWAPSAPDRTITIRGQDVTLNAEAYRDYSRLSGEIAGKMLKSIKPEATKENVERIRKGFEEARKAARAQIAKRPLAEIQAQ